MYPNVYRLMSMAGIYAKEIVWRYYDRDDSI